MVTFADVRRDLVNLNLELLSLKLQNRRIPRSVAEIAVFDEYNLEALEEGDYQEYLRRVMSTLGSLMPKGFIPPTL